MNGTVRVNLYNALIAELGLVYTMVADYAQFREWDGNGAGGEKIHSSIKTAIIDELHDLIEQ